MSGNADRGTAVGNARAEVANVARLVATGETELIVLAIDGNVLVVLLGELLNGSLDGLDASGFPHLLCRVVRVAAGTVPVARKRLGVERHLDAPLLSNADKEVAGHPEVVTHGNALAGADLELPLGGHNLGVDTANVNASVQAGAVVGLDQITGEDLASTCAERLEWRAGKSAQRNIPAPQ